MLLEFAERFPVQYTVLVLAVSLRDSFPFHRGEAWPRAQELGWGVWKGEHQWFLILVHRTPSELLKCMFLSSTFRVSDRVSVREGSRK